MRGKSGLGHVFDLLSAFFAANATTPSFGASSTTGAGTATVTATGTPTSDYDVRIEFLAGGSVGTPGITYRESLNGGASWSPTRELGAASSFPLFGTSLTGITISLGAGTVLAGEAFTVPTEGPRFSAPVLFGWREYQAQINQGPRGGNRIVIVPGADVDGGQDGSFVGVLSPGPQDEVPPPPVQAAGTTPVAAPGIRVRRLVDWQRAAVVSLWGQDPAQPQNDRASYEAVDRLVEDFVRAVYRTVPGLVKFDKPRWTDASQVQYGRELRIPFALRASLFDLPAETVSPSPVVHRNPPA